jgi:PIN domain nuclease of toxin-antitoxin system
MPPCGFSMAMTINCPPLIHRDPFDRLLLATALAGKMTFVTADEHNARYNVPHIW